jgi:hypothetical protein
MSETQNDQKELESVKIQESADGSAVIEMPGDLFPESETEKPAEKPVQTDIEGSDEEDEAAEEAEIAATGSVDPEQEAIRSAKRAKRKARKDYHRQVEAEKSVRLEQLQRQNQELLERLSVLEKKTHGSDLARIDAKIEEQENRIAFAKQKIAQAIEAQDGQTVTSAQDMLYEARRNLEVLQNFKKRAVAPTPQRTIAPPDPMIQRYAKSWMEQNPWYNPNGRDPDSRVALTIDGALTEEGFDPKTSEYWEELDSRLQKYLPHRYTDEADEKPVQRKPRAVVTGSGRENATSSGNKPGSFTLTPEQVRAMKDAGMWDDAQKRLKMIKRYAEAARQQRS